jgi:C4-dicarboxylate-specific signal transduction histidine kinase
LYRYYLRSALLPIFTIEVLLLLVYFGVNWYISGKTKETLLLDATETLPHLANKSAQIISAELRETTRLAGLLQSEHERFFADPSRFPLPGPEPRFGRATNGVLYKLNTNGSSAIYFRGTTVGPTQMDKARLTEAFDPLFQQVVNRSSNIVSAYFNSFDNLNRLYPFIPDVFAQYPPDMNIPEYNFYYLADASHNPARKPVWTGAYLDPAGQGWMVSCVVPVYRGDFLEGVTGLDVTTKNFVEQTLNLKLPWNASAFLVDESSTILAMPSAVESILGLQELKGHVYHTAISKEVLKPEEYALTRNPNLAVARQFKELVELNLAYGTVVTSDKTYLISQARIPETGWRLMIIADRDVVFSSIQVLNHLSRQIGLFMVLLMAAFYAGFFVMLLSRSRKLAEQIAAPIKDLAEATAQVGREGSHLRLEHAGVEEIDRLSDNFNLMSAELNERTRALVEAQLREQLKARETEYAYNAGLFESASSYLHNVGNSLSAVDGKLFQMRKVLEAMDGYQLALQTGIKHHRDATGLADGAEDETVRILSQLERVLSQKALPKLRGFLAEIGEIRNQMVQTIRHQQETFTQTRLRSPKFVQEVDLLQVINNVLHDLKPMLDTHGVQTVVPAGPTARVRTQKHQLIHGLMNVIKNAVESIALSRQKDSGRIEIILQPPSAAGQRSIIRVQDNGQGFSPEIQSCLFTSGFTTKQDGHGLGLHSFLVFLNENNGRIEAASPGPEHGATITVEIGDD